MSEKIIVVSNAPRSDISEFVSVFNSYVEYYKINEIGLKTGEILKFHSSHNLDGIHNYYSYKEIFESYLKRLIKDLQQQLGEQFDRYHRMVKIKDEQYDVLYKKYNELLKALAINEVKPILIEKDFKDEYNLRNFI